MPEEPKTKLDAFVAKVVGDPAKPQETLMLKGFLGASSETNHTRIYTDPTLEDYVDVANSDIVHSEPVSKEESPLGGFYVWVKKSAEALTGKAGSERKKAKFLEGPIAAQAGGAVPGPAGPGPVPGVTVPLIVCHPTLIVQFCRTHIPPLCPPPSPFPWQCGITHFPPLCPPPSPLHFCPPSPLHHCPPSPPPLLCPHTPLCPTLPVGCPPPLTVNQPQCVASGGGPACPVDTPQTPQTPQLGGGIPHAMGMAQAAGGPQLQATVWACHPSIPVWQCQQIHSVFLPCPSVPIWHCPTALIVCQHSAFFPCQTIVQPHCLPVLTAACPVVTAACPQGPFPGPGPLPGGFGQAAAAAAPFPQSVAAACLTVAATVCTCPSHFPPICPTPFCPSQHGFHCPTIHQFHCPSVQHWHCPTPACPTPQCPTAACTDIGPHCNPTPNPVHCPTPNMMCPTPTASFQCPSVGEICPTSSPLFCAAGPGVAQAGMAPQAAALPQQIQVHTTLTLQCRPSIFCPVTFGPAFCPVTFQPWCHPRTLSGVQCFTPFCPIISAICPPQQSLACGPGGFGGGFPGF